MASSRNHQGAHGIGQIEKQLNHQMEAAAEIQGEAGIDQRVKQKAKRPAKASKSETK
ncbi:hypothetical protein [Paenibacillus timonensis]|uniref:hypothetical protein n=1 Tax=Paenibacillus timonensis TaxID=225915 RepID=UPI003F9D257A